MQSPNNSMYMFATSRMQEERRWPSVYVRAYNWPDSDAEFLRSLFKDSATTTNDDNNNNEGSMFIAKNNTIEVLEETGYSCRQAELRSYNFTTKESVPERMHKCIAKVRDFPSFVREEKDGGSSGKSKGRKRKEKKKKLGDGNSSGISVMFRRMLSCTTNMEEDVEDAN